METILSIMIGVSLAAAAGFRVFVPLLVMSLAARAGQIELASELAWLPSDSAILTFSVATILEIGGYFIPWIDNLLDAAATPAAFIAGTLMIGALVTDMDPFLKWALALIAGGGTAGAVQSLTVFTRGLSTAATGGLGNPLFSSAEAGGSFVTAGMAVLLPWAAFTLVVLFLISCGRLLIRQRKSGNAT